MSARFHHTLLALALALALVVAIGFACGEVLCESCVHACCALATRLSGVKRLGARIARALGATVMAASRLVVAHLLPPARPVFAVVTLQEASTSLRI